MRKKKKIKVAAPLGATKSQELQYRRQLNKLGQALISSVRQELMPFLKTNQPQYVADGVSHQLAFIFAMLNKRFEGAAGVGFSKLTATQMMERLENTNKAKFERAMERATGVDLKSLINNEGLTDFVNLSVSRNSRLITNISQEYLNKVQVIVETGVSSGERYASIAKKISSAGGANEQLGNRIKTIATNEIQTINAQLNMKRSEKLGVTMGIFRTSEDEKVRPCHRELNGQVFVLKKGAKTKGGKCAPYIIPGVTDINCRCRFSPIIEI